MAVTVPRTSLYDWQTSETMRRGAAPPGNVWRSEVKASAPRGFELHTDDPCPPFFCATNDRTDGITNDRTDGMVRDLPFAHDTR